MSSTYSGVAGNVSLGSTAQITIPADGDSLAATSVNTAHQKEADYLEAFRLNLPGAFTEGFESATFPPTATPGWAAPSASFGTDLAYVRDTGTPLVGTASANRPGGQTASTNSSLGLKLYFASPSRIAFVFSVTCNTNSDFLQFWIDGVQYGSFTSGAANANKAGRYVSDLFREGLHTFDWRYTRGVSAAAGSEQAKIDTVEVIPESAWLGDDTRIYFKDEAVYNVPGASALLTALPANTDYWFNGWKVRCGTNVGSIGQAGTSSVGTNQVGTYQFRTSAVAINDYVQGQLMPAANGTVYFGFNKKSFVEYLVGSDVLTTMTLHFGFDDYVAANPSDGIFWAYDSSLGANWRLRVISAATITDFDTGIAVVSTGLHRLGLSVSDSPANSVVATYDGKSVPVGTGLMTTITGLPSVTTLSPGFRVKTLATPINRNIFLDWFRLLSLR